MERFWSDDLDVDLLKLLPDLPDRLGSTADTRLYTHGSRASNGRLCHPAVWNTTAGGIVTAFFGFTPETGILPPGYLTTGGVVECTWLEVLRDSWAHSYAVILHWSDRGAYRAEVLWVPPDRYFTALMHHWRGWRRLDDETRDRVLAALWECIRVADLRLRLITNTGDAGHHTPEERV